MYYTLEACGKFACVINIDKNKSYFSDLEDFLIYFRDFHLNLLFFKKRKENSSLVKYSVQNFFLQLGYIQSIKSFILCIMTVQPSTQTTICYCTIGWLVSFYSLVNLEIS